MHSRWNTAILKYQYRNFAALQNFLPTATLVAELTPAAIFCGTIQISDGCLGKKCTQSTITKKAVIYLFEFGNYWYQGHSHGDSLDSVLKNSQKKIVLKTVYEIFLYE